jgi:hypothetical protein
MAISVGLKSKHISETGRFQIEPNFDYICRIACDDVVTWGACQAKARICQFR